MEIFDYKKILKAYIKHIGKQEGIYFLGDSAEEGLAELSAEELEELRRLSKEIDCEENTEYEESKWFYEMSEIDFK